MPVLTALLELLGLGLLVSAAYLGLGLPVALAVGGACALWLSWGLSR